MCLHIPFLAFEDAKKSKKRKPAEGKSEAYPFNAGAAREREAAEVGAILPYAASVKGKMRNAVIRHRAREREAAERTFCRGLKSEKGYKYLSISAYNGLVKAVHERFPFCFSMYMITSDNTPKIKLCAKSIQKNLSEDAKRLETAV